VYKTNSMISVAPEQNFNLYRIKDLFSQNSKSSQTQTQLKKQTTTTKFTLDEKLLAMNQIFNLFYDSNSNLLKMASKLDREINQSMLLFGHTYTRSSLSGGNDLEYKFMAQVIKIYELNLRIKCATCNFLHNSCSCKDKTGKIRYEIEMSLLVDDHTSILRLNYSNLNYNFQQSNMQSNLFNSISNYLILILKDYLNEIRMPACPSCLNFDGQAAANNARLYQIFREKINSYFNATSETSVSNLSIDSNHENSLFNTDVKCDIYKTVYDYLLCTVLDNFYTFYIDLSDTFNLKEIEKHQLNSKHYSKLGGGGSHFRAKSNFNCFKLSDLDSNEQYKSILNLKCSKFLPSSVEFS
jgi:hypothetical protein